MPSIINASSSGSGGIVQTADASGVLQLQSNGTTALNISGTNVGLGTTSPAAVAGQSLQLGNQSGVFQLNVNGDMYTAHNMYYDGANWRYLTTGEASMLDFGGGRINFFRAASGTAGAVATLIPTVTVDNTDSTSVILSRGTLTFPATQNPSTNPNTLDDYEEGTFTPTLSFSGNTTGITYSSQIGKYTKIGNMVNIFCSVQLTSKGSASGVASMGGFPFSCSNTGNPVSAIYGLLSGITSQIIPYISGTTLTMEVINSGTQSSLLNTNVNNNSAFYFSMTYQVA